MRRFVIQYDVLELYNKLTTVQTYGALKGYQLPHFPVEIEHADRKVSAADGNSRHVPADGKQALPDTETGGGQAPALASPDALAATSRAL